MKRTNNAFVAAENFYSESLKELKKSKIPFMVGGTFAINHYVGMQRPTKDMDIFCKPGDFPKIMELFAKLGLKAQVNDERWLAKVIKGKYFFDVIFNAANAIVPVTDQWLKESQTAKIYDISVSVLPPTELFWSKAFIEDRYKFDGADIAHLILKRNKEINWKRLLNYMEQYWEVLLIHLLNFRFVYPSEREIVPRWLIDELLERLKAQINTPTSQMKICRGRLFSINDYAIDIHEWGFADIIGMENERNDKP